MKNQKKMFSPRGEQNFFQSQPVQQFLILLVSHDFQWFQIILSFVSLQYKFKRYTVPNFKYKSYQLQEIVLIFSIAQKWT